jgi:hypothetical protein
LQSNSAFKTSHICAGDTLLQQSQQRNRKSIAGCAQTVEDRNSLWKPQEKRTESETSRLRLRPHRKMSPDALYWALLEKRS